MTNTHTPSHTTTVQAFDNKGISVPYASTMPTSLAMKHADRMNDLDLMCAAATYRVRILGEELFLNGSDETVAKYLADKAAAKDALRRAVLFLDAGKHKASAYAMGA